MIINRKRRSYSSIGIYELDSKISNAILTIVMIAVVFRKISLDIKVLLVDEFGLLVRFMNQSPNSMVDKRVKIRVGSPAG